MKKLLILSIFCFSLSFSSNAQYSWGHNHFEVGGAVGISNYFGELVSSTFHYKHLHFSGGVFLRYNIGKYISLRLQGNYGNLSGDDKDSKNAANNMRNLHFKSHLIEVGFMAECNLMGYQPRSLERVFSPYVFLGISVFNYNPKVKHFDPALEGKWVNVKPYNTEGQGLSEFPERKTYSTTQVAIPMGLGVKVAVHSHINIGFEVGFRATFTDYIDDVGQTYAVNLFTNPPTSLYDQTPYESPAGAAFGGKSEQELMADRTYQYIVESQGGQFGVDFPTQDQYQEYVNQRGFNRGDKANDAYLITNLTVSYNFIDNGLAGARKRRKRKAGCKSAQF